MNGGREVGKGRVRVREGREGEEGPKRGREGRIREGRRKGGRPHLWPCEECVGAMCDGLKEKHHDLLRLWC